MSDSTAKSSRENQSKMLLISTPVAIATTANSGLPSPIGDPVDDNTNKLLNYIHQLAGTYEIEVDVIMKDHCYARPWNWKPENVYVKPIKKLFFPKPVNPAVRDSQKNEIIDVEEIDEHSLKPPCDLEKAKIDMNELQRVANFVKSDVAEDWEEKIDKILWSPTQNKIFTRIVKILNTERRTRLARTNSLHEPILRRTSTDSTAKKFRETLASANWDWRVTQWLHSLLFDYLPNEYLAIYLDILQSLRQKIPQLIDKMVSVQPNINSKNCLSWETLGALLKKSWDPVTPVLNTSKPKKLPGNPILIIIPTGVSGCISPRQNKWIAQLGALSMVVTVNPHLGLTANRMTMIAAMDQLVQSSRAKIQDVRVDYPGRPIILVGFNSGAALACQVAELEHVTAVVCLGFPFNTVEGKRGSPEDSLLEIRSPVMFVIGQRSARARVDDIEDMRERMLVPTSLVVVGSADDYLRISTSKKITEKISQSMVDRCILDEIADFVGGILLQPHPLPLRSPSSFNNYENRNKRPDSRKRKNSTGSSVDSEPNSPNVKKSRPHSPSSGNIIANNVTSIPASMLPRGTLVALAGTTTSTQTPRKQSRGSFSNQNISDQLITSRLTPQQQNIDSSAGGITLNIGSFASLAPVGPIRFDPTSISLQTPTTGKTSSTLKTANTFIKVSKGNQVNISGPQNVAKIKMIMPTKKAPQRGPNTYKNVNLSEKTGDMNMGNILTPTTTTVKINPPSATVTNSKAAAVNSNSNNLPSIHPPTKTVQATNTVTGKSALSSSVLFTPKTLTVTTATSTATTTTPTKVTEISTTGGTRKQTIYRYPQDQLSNSNNTSSVTNLPVAPLKRTPKTRTVSKISLKNLQDSSPQINLHPPEKNLKMCTVPIQTTTEISSTNKIRCDTSLENDLGNILDIPIIIAKDGENLNNLERLSPLPQTSIMIQPETKSLPLVNATANKVVFISNKNIANTAEFQQPIQPQGMNQIIQTRAANSVTLGRAGLTSTTQPAIKYTKIILTKRNDQEEKSSPVILTKANRRTNNLLVVDNKNDIKYTAKDARFRSNLVELKNSAKGESIFITDNSQNDLNAKQMFIEEDVGNKKA